MLRETFVRDGGCNNAFAKAVAQDFMTGIGLMRFRDRDGAQTTADWENPPGPEAAKTVVSDIGT